MKKQTAVEWLKEQYIKHSGNLLEMGKAFEKAKEMVQKHWVAITMRLICILLVNPVITILTQQRLKMLTSGVREWLKGI